MYELIPCGESSFYIESPAKLGLVLTGEGEACLIDSGSDRDAGKKVKKLLDARGWTLRAIYNTHSHADHIGGNRYLQTQTGCKIYAAGIERDFTEHPILESSYLWGGNPPKALRHKFLLAQASEVLPLTGAVLPDGWECIPLPGHSFDMVGFRSPEDVVYLADCLTGDETLAKHPVSFLTDVGAYMETLEAVTKLEGRLFVPSHAPAAEDIAPLARRNMEKVREIAGAVLRLCREPAGFEDILKGLFETFGLSMTFEQHALVGSTLRSYLTWLSETEGLTAEIEDDRLLWRSQGG